MAGSMAAWRGKNSPIILGLVPISIPVNIQTSGSAVRSRDLSPRPTPARCRLGRIFGVLGMATQPCPGPVFAAGRARRDRPALCFTTGLKNGAGASSSAKN